MAVLLMPYKIEACACSHRGLVRQNNEDAWEGVDHARFFALADGMGGHQAGEIASKEAVGMLCRVMEEKKHHATSQTSMASARRDVRHAIELANFHVYKMGRNNSDLRGMGTTVCCLYFQENGVVYGHVGDSRIYRFRKGSLEQLTRDDSLLRELIDQGQVEESEAQDFMYKNIITKAIGAEPTIEPGVHYTNMADGDIFLMCTDGLTDMLSNDQIVAALRDSPSLEIAVNTLVDQAIVQGGFDNVTVVAVRVVKEDES